jgi:hypothetical protein
MGLVLRVLSGDRPGEQRSGVAETFDKARAGFQTAWQELAPTRTAADYEAWRRQRDWTAWKDQMQSLALPLPTQRTEGIARCFCVSFGVLFDPRSAPKVDPGQRRPIP